MTPARWAPPQTITPPITPPTGSRTELEGEQSTGSYTTRYARLGALVSIIISVNALVYVSLTDRPHQLLIICLAVAGAVVAIVAAVTINYVVGGRWEMLWFGAFSGSILVLIAIGASADGGASSPIAVLLILPIVYASIAYPLRAVATIGIVALLEMLGLMIIGDDWHARDWHALVVLAVFDILAVTSAVNRWAYQESARDLAARASHDDLTGCLNYGMFNARVSTEVARAARTGIPCSLLIADIDHFKQVNDSYGHPAGDDVLCAVARVLTRGTRATDAVGRLGGDEFGVLLVDSGADAALHHAERLRTQLHELSDVVSFTVSVGIATWHGPSDTVSDLARRADQALYVAKAEGRDRVHAALPTAH